MRGNFQWVFSLVFDGFLPFFAMDFERYSRPQKRHAGRRRDFSLFRRASKGVVLC